MSGGKGFGAKDLTGRSYRSGHVVQRFDVVTFAIPSPLCRAEVHRVGGRRSRGWRVLVLVVGGRFVIDHDQVPKRHVVGVRPGQQPSMRGCDVNQDADHARTSVAYLLVLVLGQELTYAGGGPILVGHSFASQFAQWGVTKWPLDKARPVPRSPLRVGEVAIGSVHPQGSAVQPFRAEGCTGAIMVGSARRKRETERMTAERYIPRRPTVQGRNLGAQLRRLRDEAGVSADAAADRLECSRAKISRIETGHVPVRIRDVRDLLDLYGVTDETLSSHLEGLAKGSTAPGWWWTYDDTLPPAYADYLDLERKASEVYAWQAVLIPGLLQTSDYARAITSVNPAAAKPESVETFVKVRHERQAKFWSAPEPGDEPTRLSVVLWEPVIMAPMGSRETMRAQVKALIERSEDPRVNLQVLPLSVGAHAGVSGSFVMLRFPSKLDNNVVYCENLTSTLFMEKTADTDGYRQSFELLTSAAEGPAETRIRLKRALDAL